MAKYKNREVDITLEYPVTATPMVQIQHRELELGTEIVPRNQVIVSQEEYNNLKKQRDEREKASKENEKNDYQIEGKTEVTQPAPTPYDINRQRRAEANLERAEKQAEEDKEWQKKHPNVPSQAKRELDAIKVVPYKDEEDVKQDPNKGVQPKKVK